MTMSGSGEVTRRAAGYESLTVAVVARLVGVAPSTLRTWARRYGLEPSGHRSGLHRRYSETDVARLRYMRALTQSGMTSRDAASRAMRATPDELSLAPRGDESAVPPVAEPRSEGLAAPAVRRVVGELPTSVRALLATAARGDAQGATALLRVAVRELGAARTWDERVLPARAALLRLPPAQRPRGTALISAAAVTALGEIRLRRARRNTVAVHLVCAPGCEDAAAAPMLRAALAERSVAADAVSLDGTRGALAQVLAGVGSGLMVVHVGEGGVQAQLAARVRQLGPAEQLHWGAGWVGRPGRAGTMADLVREVEAVTCPPVE